MKYRDKWETDEDGNRYIFTVEMQRALHEADLPIEADALERLPSRVLNDLGIKIRRKSAEPDDEPETIQIDPASGKFLGRLKNYRRDRGYGFIARGGGESIFFHRSKTLDDPEEYEKGQWLLYEVMETNRGFEAFDVERYDGELV